MPTPPRPRRRRLSDDVVRAVLARCDLGDNPWSFSSDERAALRKAARLRLVRPARFAPATGYHRPAILAYALTPAGRLFLDPLAALAAVVVESYGVAS